MNRASILETELRAHKDKLLERRERLRVKIKDYNAKLAGFDAQTKAVELLLAQFTTASPEQGSLSIPTENSVTRPRRRKGGRETVVEACAAVLSQRNEAMHIKDLAAAIESRIAPGKSKDPVQIVGILLRRSPKFERVSPGVFRLANSHCDKEG